MIALSADDERHGLENGTTLETLPAEDPTTDMSAEKKNWSSREDNAAGTDPLPRRGLTWWQASFSIVVVVVGAGVMALGHLPTKGGMYLSWACLLLCGATITESGMEMYRGIMCNNQRASGGEDKAIGSIVSYEDFGRAAFGDLGELLALVCQSCYFIGCAATFSVLIADSMEHLTDGLLSSENYLLALYPLFAGLALLPDVTAVAQLVPVAVVSIMALCGIVIFKSIVDSQRWQVWPDVPQERIHKSLPGSFMDLGVVVATLFGAFGVNGNVPSVLCEMKDPKDFPFAFKSAMGFIGFLYILMMSSSYYGYGEFMQSDIVNSVVAFPDSEFQAFNVPFSEWTGPKAPMLEDILSAFLLVKITVGYPLNLMAIFYSLQTFKYTKSYFPVSSWPNKIMRLAIVAVAVLIARLVPDFSQLFALVCSVFGPLLQCFLPILFGYRLRYLHGARRSGVGRQTLHSFMLLLSLFTITVGFTQALQDILVSQA